MATWELYECSIDDHRAFVAVDVSLYDDAPDPERTCTIRATVPLLSPRVDGLPDTPERPRLAVIEETLTRILGEIGAVRVGRASFAGAVRHYFYAPDPDLIDAAADRCIAAIGDRAVQLGSYDDPDWQQYFDFLYPNPLAWQYILDARTLEALRDGGDDLERPRSIDHHADFATAGGRDAFADAVRARGYAVVATDDPDEPADPALPHAIHFAKALAPAQIFPVTIELVRLSEAHGGEYDGWGCEVETG